MKISRQIWSFLGFATAVLLGFIGFWMWGKLKVHSSTGWLTIWLIVPIGLVTLAGVLGMVWWLFEWFVSGMVTLYRAVTARRKNARHEKSSA
jgi:hypothetical protein